MSLTDNMATTAESEETTGQLVVSTSRPKSLAGNASWSLLSWGLLTGLTLLLTPFLVSHLGTYYYGLYVLVIAIGGLLGLADLGLADATLRYVAYYYSRHDLVGINRAVGATLSIYLATGLLAWAILFFGAPQLAGLLAIQAQDLGLAVSLLRLMATSVGLMTITGAYGTVPRALQRYDVETKVTVGQNVIQLVGTVALLLAGFGVYQVMLWSLLSVILRQTTNIIVARRLIPHLRLLPSPSREGLREVLSYGVFSSLTQTVSMVAYHADRLLLGTLVGASAVGYLNVPKSLVQRGGMVAYSMSDVLFPRFSATQDLTEQRRLFLNATWSMLCATVLLFVPVTVLLPDFLRLWIGAEFARESAWVGQLLCCGAILRGAAVPSQKLFQGAGKPQYVTVWYAVSSVILTGLNLLLIGRLGLSGVGYASLIELVVALVVILFAWRRVLRSNSWRPLGGAVLLPSLIGFACLGLFWWVRSTCPSLSWLGMAALEAAFVLGTAIVLLGTDLLWYGASSYASTFLSTLSRLLQRGPWSRWHPGVMRPR
jgi:O-antigen/teichoic acid export membrane protein